MSISAQQEEIIASWHAQSSLDTCALWEFFLPYVQSRGKDGQEHYEDAPIDPIISPPPYPFHLSLSSHP